MPPPEVGLLKSPVALVRPWICPEAELPSRETSSVRSMHGRTGHWALGSAGPSTFGEEATNVREGS